MSTTPASSKTRSPNYPAIALPEAIGRTRTIYEKQQTYPATREIIARLMGYGGLNGASAIVVSALSKYGLIEGHGENLRVSSLGQDLVLHRRGEEEYERALRTAAFMPTFFRELRDQYPHGLPSEHSLRATLIKGGFNAKSVDGAVRAYRETLEFLESELQGSPATAPETQTATVPTAGTGRPPTPSGSAATHRSIAIPLSSTEWATLDAPFPLCESAWKQMMAVLNAMKPALVETTDGHDAETSADRSDVPTEGASNG